MDKRHINIFITVAKEKSFTKASKILYISQPAVSEAIKEIETYYGAKMFERLNKKIFLTNDGKILYKKGQHILNNFEELNRAFYLSPKQINIGATLSIGSTLLPKIMIENSDIDYSNIIVDNTNNIEEKLLNNDIDIALIEGEFLSNNFITKPFFKDEIVFIRKKDYIPKYKDTLLLREKGSGTRLSVTSFLKMKGHSFESNYTVSSNDSMINLLMSGIGYAGICKNIVLNYINDGTFEVLKNYKITRDFKYSYHKDKHLNESMEKIISYLDNTVF